MYVDWDWCVALTDCKVEGMVVFDKQGGFRAGGFEVWVSFC